MKQQLAGEINFTKNWQRRINTISGTKIGGRKAAETNRKLHGDDFYSRIGRKGGKVATPTGGFGSNIVGKDGMTGRERAKEAGRKGGLVSRRGPAV